jgi:hypothetical protein
MTRFWWRKTSAPDDAEREADERDAAQRMSEARSAQQEGKEALERAYAQWGEVSDLAQVLRELRSRNHFSEQVKVMLQRASSATPRR